jgi:hypothetical protein
MTPKRIKRKNYMEKLPPNSKAVHRRSRWGNPHEISETLSAAECMRMYRTDLMEGNLRTGKDGRYHITVDYVRKHLKGFNLACLCDLGTPCHGDVLLQVANSKGGA